MSLLNSSLKTRGKEVREVRYLRGGPNKGQHIMQDVLETWYKNYNPHLDPEEDMSYSELSRRRNKL
jgi:hypothetical protein